MFFIRWDISEKVVFQNFRKVPTQTWSASFSPGLRGLGYWFLQGRSAQSIFGTPFMELTLGLLYEPHKEISFTTLLSHLISSHSHAPHSWVSPPSQTDFAFSPFHTVLATGSPKEWMFVAETFTATCKQIQYGANANRKYGTLPGRVLYYTKQLL